MPEQAEFVADDTGTEAKIPYIQYAPWEPAAAPSYDLRTLSDKVTQLQAKVTHLEAIVHKYINRDDQDGNDAGTN